MMEEPVFDRDLVSLNQIEIKKELSDENDTLDDTNEMDEDSITSNDGIFEVIPFMAKLLSNLKCSFYSRNNEIVVASIELMSVHELIDRLIRNRIRPNRMDCGTDSTFTLTICDDQFIKSFQFNTDTFNIIRYLPSMAIVTECSNLSLSLENSEMHIRSISYDSLASLMIRLKQYDIRPKQVDSLKDSAFSLVFNDASFANVENVHKLFPHENSCDLLSVRRPRISPNYLRDYIVENKDGPVSGLDLIPSYISKSNYLQLSHKNLSESSSKLIDENSGIKRGRGRPRIRPKPCDISLDSNQIKKPRGRPRRSDVIPAIVARTNSFINIQPKGLSVQDLETCFVKFLESDLCHSK